MRQKYGPAPWTFKGDALYQFNLVRESEARKHIPREFKIVSLFGWTLGGVYLVRYTDSPVGAFDELVVLAGIVWNPPTSCAWAQRVYVSNKAARDHGLNSVGLPSRLATFGRAKQAPVSTGAVGRSELPKLWWSTSETDSIGPVVVKNVERGRYSMKEPVGEFIVPSKYESKGPRMHLTLPNFSGGTAHHPGLLHYTCKMSTNIRPVSFIKNIRPCTEEDCSEDVSHVLNGKPLLCLAFDDLEMLVPEAQPWLPKNSGASGAVTTV